MAKRPGDRHQVKIDFWVISRGTDYSSQKVAKCALPTPTQHSSAFPFQCPGCRNGKWAIEVASNVFFSKPRCSKVNPGEFYPFLGSKWLSEAFPGK